MMRDDQVAGDNLLVLSGRFSEARCGSNYGMSSGRSLNSQAAARALVEKPLSKESGIRLNGS
jgi:hypothetical protein